MDTVPPARIVGEESARHAAAGDGLQRRLVVAVVWTLVIMVLCWMPSKLVREAERETSWFKIPHFDKIVHCAIFAIFAVLWLRTRSSRRPFGLVIMSGFVLAVLTEIVQGLPLIGRDTSAADMFTDGIGVLIGVAVAPLVEPLAQALESRLFRKASALPLEAEPATAATEVRS